MTQERHIPPRDNSSMSPEERALRKKETVGGAQGNPEQAPSNEALSPQEVQEMLASVPPDARPQTAPTDDIWTVERISTAIKQRIESTLAERIQSLTAQIEERKRLLRNVAARTIQNGAFQTDESLQQNILELEGELYQVRVQSTILQRLSATRLTEIRNELNALEAEAAQTLQAAFAREKTDKESNPETYGSEAGEKRLQISRDNLKALADLARRFTETQIKF